MKLYNTIKRGKGINTIAVNYKTCQLTEENKKYLQMLRQLIQPKKGTGLVNTALKRLPIPEMHLNLPAEVSSESVPNGSFANTGKYSFCGPGTKVNQRLHEGYKGVNILDKACRSHDIYYANHKKTKERNLADDVLAKAASEITLNKNEPEYVRSDAKLVTGVMGLKSRFGMGVMS